MKNVKVKRTALEEVSQKSQNGFISIIKGVVFAYFFTTMVFIIYGLLLTYTDITENNVQMVVMITTVVSVLICGFISSRGVNSKGLLYGMVSGIIYAIIMVTISFCILPKIVINPKIIMIIILSIASGGVGGIIGINTKKSK